MGWQGFQTSCYKLNSEKTDWETAQKTCQKMEANLVSIHTLPELEFITRSVKQGEKSDPNRVAQRAETFCLSHTLQSFNRLVKSFCDLLRPNETLVQSKILENK